MSHTKGPWAKVPTSGRDPFAVRHIVGTSGEKIATINRPRSMSEDEALDNAALVYAAPEMLEALEGLFESAQAAKWHPGNSIMRNAQAAISKARGRSA